MIELNTGLASYFLSLEGNNNNMREYYSGSGVSAQFESSIGSNVDREYNPNRHRLQGKVYVEETKLTNIKTNLSSVGLEGMTTDSVSFDLEFESAKEGYKLRTPYTNTLKNFFKKSIKTN